MYEISNTIMNKFLTANNLITRNIFKNKNKFCINYER